MRDERWMIAHIEGANVCDNLNGMVCDYPNTNPAFRMVCLCSAYADAGSGSTWTCFQSTTCPATQPAYSLTDTCAGRAVCTYSVPDSH